MALIRTGTAFVRRAEALTAVTGQRAPATKLLR